MSRRAPLIAIEGMDGCGKSTATRRLGEALSERGLEVATYDFPVYDEPDFGPLIARFLRGGFGGIGASEPWFAGMIFAGNRAALAARMRAEMEEGKVIVCDRFSYSNIAYQTSKLPAGEDLEAYTAWLIRLEFELFDTPRPDMSFWLRVPPELRPAAGGADRGERDYLEGEEDVHEGDEALQVRVHRTYERLAAEREDLETVDCAPEGSLLPPERVTELLLERLDGRGLLGA